MAEEEHLEQGETHSRRARSPSSSEALNASTQSSYTSRQLWRSKGREAESGSALFANAMKEGERLSWRQCSRAVWKWESLSYEMGRG